MPVGLVLALGISGATMLFLFGAWKNDHYRIFNRKNPFK